VGAGAGKTTCMPTELGRSLIINTSFVVIEILWGVCVCLNYCGGCARMYVIYVCMYVCIQFVCAPHQFVSFWCVVRFEPWFHPLQRSFESLLTL
jgi:hypothetical protein